jgi:hypothetical protein
LLFRIPFGVIYYPLIWRGGWRKLIKGLQPCRHSLSLDYCSYPVRGIPDASQAGYHPVLLHSRITRYLNISLFSNIWRLLSGVSGQRPNISHSVRYIVRPFATATGISLAQQPHNPNIIGAINHK